MYMSQGEAQPISRFGSYTQHRDDAPRVHALLALAHRADEGFEAPYAHVAVDIRPRY